MRDRASTRGVRWDVVRRFSSEAARPAAGHGQASFLASQTGGNGGRRSSARPRSAICLVLVGIGLLLGLALVATAWAQGTGVPEGPAVEAAAGTGTSGDVIRLDSVHMIVESFDQVLRITEIHLFGNGGDEAYAGESGDASQGTVFIPLPENAVGLAYGEGVADDRFLDVEGGLMDTEPVPPGTQSSEVVFSYHLLVAGETVPLERRFAYPVTNLNVLVAQPGLTLKSEQLEFMGTQAFEDRQYELYRASDLAPDTPLMMELVPVDTGSGTAVGMPPASDQGGAGSAATGNQRLLLGIGLGLAVLAVVVALVYPQLVRRPATAAGSASNLAANPKARPLLVELADLEDAFESGQIDEVTYERRRAEKREELRSL
jgi:hypothetical protein